MEKIIIAWLIAGLIFAVWFQKQVNKIYLGNSKIRIYHIVDIIFNSLAGLIPYVVLLVFMIKYRIKKGWAYNARW